MPRGKRKTKTPQNRSKDYYNLAEEEMQSLITRAKNKDGLAQAELLKVFHNFLTKYVSLLFYSRLNLNDYDQRKFLSLFVKDNTIRFALIGNKLKPAQFRAVIEVLRGIQYMVVRYADILDVEQTISLAFLSCIDRYEQKGEIPFSGFLYSYFFYVLKKHVDTHLIDQLGRKTFPLITEEDLGEDDGNGAPMPPGFVSPSTPSAEDLIFMEEIDEKWVMDCSNRPFSVLTIQERQLLKWRYVDGQSSNDIAVRVSEHQNTIREKINRAKTRLIEVIQEDLALDESKSFT